ncbi:hypothetical protein [Sporotomaculum syntrophicum]
MPRVGICSSYVSLRNASIGFILAALLAGSMPKIMLMAAEKVKAINIVHQDTSR